MFVLNALYPAPFLPRHHVTPGANQCSLAVPMSKTPNNQPHHPQLLLLLLSTTIRVNVPPTLQCLQSILTLPSKERQNIAEKRQNGPMLHSLSKRLMGPSWWPQSIVWLTMMITSQVVALQCSYTLALVCPFAIQKQPRAHLFPCVSCLVTWQIISNAVFLSICEAWRVSEELPIQVDMSTHSIRY